jgi:hypothetical protein
MARLAQSRNLKGFGWLTKKRVTYHRDVAKERRELKRDAMEARKERIALKELEAKERAADAKIAAAQRKLETAAKKTDTGGMSEAKFEAMKARMEKEIEKQEQFKAAALAKVNPSWGYGIYQGSPGFGANDQVAHFKSKAAAETYARSKGLTGYRIRRAFAKNPCASTRKTHVSDRAKRYRANQRGCKPAGVRKCKLCGSKSDVMVDHIDGNESNGSKRNLRWLCRSCNTLLGAEMARTGQGRRTVQYNPQGAQTLGEYVLAVLEHTRGAHDEAGKLIHATPKWKRQEYASEIWAARKARGNPAVSPEQYRLAQAVLSGTARQTHMSPEAAREIVDRTPAKLRSEYSKRNPCSSDKATSPEYQLGYSLGQRDRETATLPRTWAELEATFGAKFDPTRANALWFFEAYKVGYEPTGGTTTGNPRGQTHRGLSRNPEPAQGDGSEEYQQALRTAELFHGRPVKEQIEVEEKIRTHDWYVSIGPLVKLIIKPLTKKPRKRVPLPFHQSEAGQVQLFCSPDGRQFYLRGGDQELDLDAFGMGQGSKWYRDHMKIGEAVEITYRDRKKFHSFKLTDYFHKLGEETGDKPTLVYDSLSKKLGIIGGAYRIEMEDLVDGMSPGIVN